MARNEKTGVRATQDGTIQIEFIYRKERCRERLKLEPTPANLKKAEDHRQAILEAIEAGTFVYRETFPDSPRANAVFPAGAEMNRCL